MIEQPKIFTLAKQYIAKYTTQLIIVAIVALSWQGLKAYQKYLKVRQTQLEQQADVLKGQVKELTKQNDTLVNEKSIIAAKNIELDKTAKYWQNKAKEVVVIPPHGVAPKTQQIIAELEPQGVIFTPSTEKLIFTTPEPSLPIIWGWNKDSLRIPSLQFKIDTTVTALGKTEEQVVGLQSEINKDKELFVVKDKRDLARIEQVDNLNKQVSTVTKQVKAEKTNGWIKTGAALVTGFLIGKQIKK